MPWPTAMGELEQAERLIVWAYRHWVNGLIEGTGAHWSQVWNEFRTRFGPDDGREAMSGFTYLIKELQCASRRTLRYHQPGCACVGADEAILVGFLAACQNGDSALSRALAERLVAPEGVGGLLDAGGRLARILGRHGSGLPGRIRIEEIEAGLDWLGLAEGTVH